MLNKVLLIIFIIKFLLIKLIVNNELNNLLYDTTSGVYKASLVKLDGDEFEKPKYLHKLISIPYAEKPERFQQSILRKYRNGVNGIQKPVSCYQSVNLSSYGLFNVVEPPHMTEDCLVVNLYIPVASSPEEESELKNMSLVVHIHGGSNMVGAASLFDGSIFAAKGKIIVAIINYRLSILGFLSDMSKNYPGNYGLRDQILAIKWIKMNCKVLNCNPESITLWGHSAGAGDVNWLAISPLSNKLFQRAIIQSGSAFSYWGFDRLPFDRYKALKKYFNCTNLPEYHSKENKAMTQLIENCLSKVSLEILFSFKFALIDAPGPTYDGFLGKNSLINYNSPGEMLKNVDDMANLDIMTGINGVEGFSFEGYFSNSVKFFTKQNLANEVILTIERFSLLSREKCKQNLLIENRLKLDEYYEKKVKKYLKNEKDLNLEEVKRLKAIFANSDAIFDSGFIELLKHISNKKSKLKKSKSNLFVYEYLHENSGNKVNLDAFKKHLNDYPMSTHFDGIDLVFGLPIAKNMKRDINYDYPFQNFTIENTFDEEESKLSLILMDYYSNFIKNGDPNIGKKVFTKWEPYTNQKAYLKLDSNLINTNDTNLVTYGIRDELYDFWFDEMEKTSNCSKYDSNSIIQYVSGKHTNGKDGKLDRCFDLLNRSEEYNYLREMFLIEYENCMNAIENYNSLKNLFNTICLDVIAIRRLIIEYDLCCKDHHKNVTSTICSMENFNEKFINYSLENLIEYAIKNTNSSNCAFTRIFITIKLVSCFLIIFIKSLF